SQGLMGSLADGALSKGGEVIGILPKFMADLEWGHPGLTHLELVGDMRERKHKLLTGSDAVVALPGGCGTLEELFEAITLKRSGLYVNPIILLDTLDYWQPLDAFLHRVIEQRFMNPEHAKMWSLAATPEGVLPAIKNAPKWDEHARDRAVVR
ncbi:MAG TPA: TIGR00730 family Rossman fold protein, partial [Rhodanobacteraceae bacterium]|nr:TIGR00730 family Rossman fold protein [Rhodanobacteraceae bacterium]